MIESVRQALQHANDSILSIPENLRQQLSALENLRQQIDTPLEVLPVTLRANEAWLRSTVKQRLFAKMDLTEPLTEKSVSQVLANYTNAQNNLILQGTVEQSLATV